VISLGFYLGDSMDRDAVHLSASRSSEELPLGGMA
jgi:hypothetical protein